jgi:hypothetical protein
VGQDPVLASLEPTVPARPLLVPIVFLADLGEFLVPQLDRRLDLSAADQDRLGAVGGGDDRVDAQVDLEAFGGWFGVYREMRGALGPDYRNPRGALTAIRGAP